MKNDLISREALKKALRSNCTPEICHDCNTSWCRFCCPHNDFEDLIENAPTVEQRPRGNWVEDWREDLDFKSKKGWTCSFCKWRTTYGTPNFCMNCGAQMDKGGEV